MLELTIYLSDDPDSETRNDDVLSFIEDNLDRINENEVTIVINAVDPDDDNAVAELANLGIKRGPALLSGLDDPPVTGAAAVKTAIRTLTEQNAQRLRGGTPARPGRPQQRPPSDESSMEQYQQALLATDDEDDEYEKFSNNLGNKMREQLDSRRIGSGGTSLSNPTQTNATFREGRRSQMAAQRGGDNVSASIPDDAEDAAMLRQMFENMGES
jgi:hypothetical protein